MSVRQGMLALLAEQPMHGYQLRQQFDARMGGTWPLNIGQVYTTVQRLVRDGLVEPVPESESPDLERFRLTEAGRSEVSAWWSRPVRARCTCPRRARDQAGARRHRARRRRAGCHPRSAT